LYLGCIGFAMKIGSFCGYNVTPSLLLFAVVLIATFWLFPVCSRLCRGRLDSAMTLFGGGVWDDATWAEKANIIGFYIYEPDRIIRPTILKVRVPTIGTAILCSKFYKAL
jgi:hypothetical protein